MTTANQPQVNSSFELSNVLLHRVRSSVPEVEDTNSDLSIGINVFSHVTKTQIQTHLTVKLSAHSELVTEKTPFPSYRLDYCTLGIFNIPENATEEEIKNFAGRISFAVLIPFAREFSADIARRMGIAGNYMPVFNPEQLLKSLEEHNSITVSYEDDE